MILGYLGRSNAITGGSYPLFIRIRGRQECQKQRGDVKMVAEVVPKCFEGEGRGYKLKKVGNHQKLDKARNQILP